MAYNRTIGINNDRYVDSQTKLKKDLETFEEIADYNPILIKQDVMFGKMTFNILVNFTDIYSYEKTLGSGGFGSVDVYIHNANGMKVAIKRILMRDSESSFEYLHKEVSFLKSATAIGYESIPKYYDSFVIIDKGNHYYCIVMEYIEGISLYDYIDKYLRRNSLVVSENFAVKFSIWLFDTLAFIHSKGWVHRDIKPENVMLDTKNKRFVLIDFGFACSIRKIPGDVNNCRENDDNGTNELKAPERAEVDQSKWFENFDPSSPTSLRVFIYADIWSAAMTIYYLLHQRYPWNSSDSDKIRKQLASKNFTIYYNYKNNIKSTFLDRLHEIVDKGLSYYPEQRGSASQLSMRLKEAFLPN